MTEKRSALVKRATEIRKEYKKLRIDGELLDIPFESEKVEAYLYRPKSGKISELPVLIEVHGGAWLYGDAAQMNSFCCFVAEKTPAIVVNLNYKKIDYHPFPYQQKELAETVRYLYAHADYYGINNTMISICGQSAGGHICIGAAILLKEMGIPIRRQILVYPTTDFARLEEIAPETQFEDLLDLRPAFFPDYPIHSRLISPMHNPQVCISGTSPVLMILSGKDMLKEMGDEYAAFIRNAGVQVETVLFEDAVHGFLETNREENIGNPLNSPLQDYLARECEKLIISVLREDYKQSLS